MVHFRYTVFVAHILYCFQFMSECCVGLAVQGYENGYGPGYGSEWIYFVDEHGDNHFLNFSSFPPDQRGLEMGDTYFQLYTRNNIEAEELTVPDDDQNITSLYFNASNELKILTHGWLSSSQTAWVQKIKNSLLTRDEMNVILVDWSELASNPVYPLSAAATRAVGRRIAQLIAALDRTYQLGGDRIHLIGHSLGAHVMGYAGMFSNSTISRITGLDPARPLFEIPPMAPQYRLDRSDARFVDVIHSCGGFYGYLRCHGHADFFPNSGRPPQPGCEGAQQIIEACSHGRSCEFFEESILSERGFAAFPCASWARFRRGQCRSDPALMGLPADPARTGRFYLKTNAEPPYAIPN